MSIERVAGDQIVALANIIVCDRPDAPLLQIPTELAGLLKRTENPLDLEDTEAGLLWQAPVSQRLERVSARW